MGIKQGDKVKVEYTGTLENGEVFDSSEKQGKPLEFEIGAGQIIKGFEQAVIGMEKGEEKEITLKPEQAYGDYNPELVKKVPKDKLPEEAKQGAMLMMHLPNGMNIPAKVKEIGEKEATLDLNHPLAGKTLIFKIKITDIF